MREPWFREYNKCWYITINGKAVPLGKDKRTAFAKWHELEEGELEGLDMAFPKAVELYLESLAKCSADTKDVSSRHLKDFEGFVGKIKCSKLRAHHWTAFVRTKDWKPSTQRTALNKIRACLNYAVEQGRLDPHKFRIGKKDIPQFERRKDIVTEEEQRTLEAGARGPFKDFLIGMRLSGCRPGELSDALIENLDLKEGILYVANKTAKSTGEDCRPVYLSPELMGLILRLKRERTNGHIWRNSQDTPWNRWSLVPAMRRLRLKLNMRKGITLYGYRGRYATSALENGVDAISVSELLGHKSLDMVKRHYGPSPSNTRSVETRFDDKSRQLPVTR